MFYSLHVCNLVSMLKIQIVLIKFVINYGDSLSVKWKLNLSNGYSVRVDFDRTNYKLVGVRDLLVDHGLSGGEVLIFEYVDRITFHVFIIG